MLKNISLELVPRNIPELIAEAHFALERYAFLDKINIPDLKRLGLRSIDAAKALLEASIAVVPHIRTQDYGVEHHLQLLEPLVNAGLKELLLVSGDAFADVEASGCTPIQLTVALKKEFPELFVFGALDPYRAGVAQELEYTQQKLDAGMDGIFSQPFFCTRLLEIYLEQCRNTTFYVGFSPVLAQKSAQYWQKTNKVVFPEGFSPTLEWNHNTCHRVLQKTAEFGQKAYLMPIRMGAAEFLTDFFGEGKDPA
jgi:methylenetetrahydrofolate reductase (NADPH)